MPGDSRTVAHTIPVIVLLVLATVALRGYLPGAAPDTAAPEESSGTGSLAAVVAMLLVSMTVIALSLLKQSPRRRAAADRADLPSDGHGERLPWRPMLIVAAALLVWLAVLYLLLRWAGPAPVDPPPAASSGDRMPPEDATTTPPPMPTEPADSDTDMFAVLASATLVLVVLTVVAAIRGRRLPAAASSAASDATPNPAMAPSGDTDLARAAELGLAEIEDLSRDPRHAIIACYAAMERELGKSPGATPQDSDTPAEVLARAIETHVLRSGSAGELVDLFEEARFSPHVMDEGHRADAVRALQLVQRELADAT